MRRCRALVMVATAVAGVLGMCVPAAPAAAAGLVPSSALAPLTGLVDAGSAEATFLDLTNAARARGGVAPLAVDGLLVGVARTWSGAMARVGSISHNPLLGSLVPDWKVLGENVGTGGDPAGIERAFEASPGHLANLMNPDFLLVGIGAVVSGGSIFVTLDFKRPSGAGAGTTPAPAPAPSTSAPPRTTTPAPVRPVQPVATTAPRPAATVPASVAPPATVPVRTPAVAAIALTAWPAGARAAQGGPLRMEGDEPALISRRQSAMPLLLGAPGIIVLTLMGSLVWVRRRVG